MAVEKHTIRSITDPTIILDDLVFLDTESGSNTAEGKPITGYKPSAQHGGAFPMIKINAYLFPSEQVISMRISSSGDRPYFNASILIKDKSFYSTSFPKDGDLASVFIRGLVDPFKPLHNDYEITSVHISSDPGSGENDFDTMFITGVLRIPGYDAVKCFSYTGTSYKALMKVATDLKLGFASNEVDTQDSQTWICPNEKTKDYIKELSLSSWKDDNSFFDYFIDPYYYLNFVNVEPFYSESPDIDEAISILRMSNDYGTDSKLATSKTQIVLSNWDEISQTQFYINHHTLINNSSAISLSNGYKRYAQYYDGLVKENQSFFVDPKITSGAEETKQLLKGRPNEDFYLQQINTKWLGVQYGKDGENSHPMYNFAKINNYQNNVHLRKMGLKISLSTLNFNLRRMQTVPVVIIIKKDTVRKKLNEPTELPVASSGRETPTIDAESVPFLPDRTVSGFYTIHEIEYIYEQGSFRQECTLLRREWATPPQVH